MTDNLLCPFAPKPFKIRIELRSFTNTASAKGQECLISVRYLMFVASGHCFAAISVMTSLYPLLT